MDVPCPWGTVEMGLISGYVKNSCLMQAEFLEHKKVEDFSIIVAF